MSGEEAVSDQRSAISPESGGPLTDAHCLKCGYPLRGLPENRCPECGTAFDPAVFAGTFLPQWPRLMVWYLTACVIAKLIELLPALVRWNPYLLLVHALGEKPLRDPVNIMHLAATALTCLLGPICIIGLHRRRDWARKGCMVIFAATALFCITAILRLPDFPPRFLNLKEFIRLSLTILFYVGFLVQPAVIMVFLATGLRRKSLWREADHAPPERSRTAFHPKRDWLLLTLLVLCGLGVAQTFGGGLQLHSLWLASKLSSSTTPFARGSDLFAVEAALTILVGVFTTTAAVWLWRWPGALRTVVTLATAATIALSGFTFIAEARWAAATGAPASDPIEVVLDILHAIGSLLPYLALLLFAFLAVSRDDIRRMAWAGSK